MYNLKLFINIVLSLLILYAFINSVKSIIYYVQAVTGRIKSG